MSIDMEFNSKTIAVPSAYICPITLNLMSHPLLSKTGIHYERSAILGWLLKSNTCPLTRQPLHLSHLISDQVLENEIKRFKETHAISQQVHNQDVADHCTDDEKCSVYAIANYSRCKQKISAEQYQSERIRRMIRRALA